MKNETKWQFRMWLGWYVLILAFKVFPLSTTKIHLAKFVLDQPLEDFQEVYGLFAANRRN